MNPWQVKSAFYAFFFRLPPFCMIRKREHAKLCGLLETIDPPPETVVDVGTGVGGGLWPLTGCNRLICVDRCFGMIRRSPAKWIRLVAEACYLPLVSDCTRMVTAIGLLEYLSDPLDFIAEAARSLEKGGYFLVTASPPGVFSRLRNVLGNKVHPILPDHLEAIMRAQGFSIIGKSRTLIQVQFLCRWNGYSQKQA